MLNVSNDQCFAFCVMERARADFEQEIAAHVKEVADSLGVSVEDLTLTHTIKYTSGAPVQAGPNRWESRIWVRITPRWADPVLQWPMGRPPADPQQG